ncbi:UDP-glycosyltransferase 87A1 [Morus notabilis]|uniref:UDP-glycosyltransferase 87A1 n=1 Tax=Morus notabilis TaxID=981085 RepID=W9RA27_9ROSA|nr:UDP-glycosyltransferase 87A1 [Morus notabilis]
MEPPATNRCHVVAVPYPGRGHINPMMNICEQIASRKPNNILITFVVTEEWLGLIGPRDPTMPDNIRFATIPNVVPSEHDRAKDLPAFVEAVFTKMEAPFEELLDRVEIPVIAIVADSNLLWAYDVGNRRNIPVASLWPMSTSVFSVIYHFELLKQNGHFPVDLSERGHEVVDYIPGISTIRLADLPGGLLSTDNTRQNILQKILEVASRASKAQCLLFSSVYELESQVSDALKAKFPFPPVYTIGPSIPYLKLEASKAKFPFPAVYTIGPSIPYLKLEASSPTITNNGLDYLKWLDSQPKKSVLYVSFGSFLSISSAQMDEIVAGIKNSGTRYLWVARGDASKIKDGGFWSHCGWNSTSEAIFSGVPILTFPIIWDQVSNSKQIVEDWKIGYKVKKGISRDEDLVTRVEIAEIVKRFMDLENREGKLMRERVKKLQEVCRRAIEKGGSSDANLDAFIMDISHGN